MRARHRQQPRIGAHDDACWLWKRGSRAVVAVTVQSVYQMRLFQLTGPVGCRRGGQLDPELVPFRTEYTEGRNTGGVSAEQPLRSAFTCPCITRMGSSAARLGFRPPPRPDRGRGGSLARADPDLALFVRCDGQGGPILASACWGQLCRIWSKTPTGWVGPESGRCCWFCFLSRVGLGWVENRGAVDRRIDDDGHCLMDVFSGTLVCTK